MKILALDIETSYITAGIWSLWNNNVGVHQILEPPGILCWAAKWVGEKGGMMYASTADPAMLDKLHNLLDDADAVLTYNGKKFDIPIINREFLLAGLPPPSPYKQIDLLDTFKRLFRFSSNKLAYVTGELGIGTKVDHEGFPLWIKCMSGDERAWKKMRRYNMQDVRLLEKLYRKVRAWIPNHPNHNLYGQTGTCPTCGSRSLQRRGTYTTQTGVYQRHHCQNCGAWSRSRFTEVPAEDRRNILTNVALT